MELIAATYRVISPATAACVAKIVVGDTGLEILLGPEFTKRVPTDGFFGQGDVLDIDRATEILRRDRLKMGPDFMAGHGHILFKYESVSDSAGDLILQAQRREVLPPGFIDTLITHAVTIVVFYQSEPIGELSITGFLPIDGSPVKKQLVVRTEAEGLFVKEG